MSNYKQKGFTLIELVIFMIVVSVAVVGVLSVINQTVKSSADPMVRKQAAALADSILEEVLLKEYNDPDATNSGETGRDNYDDVDDFNGKTQALFTDLPTEVSGYTIAITVATPAALNGVTMKQVTVTATRGSDSVSMIGYRANY
jgi:MSHA pilin protein MshD